MPVTGGMFGTAHWCGTYDGRPALTLSYYGGADLWVFGDEGWRVERRCKGLRDLHELLGVAGHDDDYKEIQACQ